MSFLWRQKTSPFKAFQKYSKVIDSASRASSDESRGSDDGLLEKEIEELRRKTPLWRRHASLIVLNSIIFIIYAASLYAVASHVPNRCQQGPNLVFCELLCHFLRPAKLIKQHPHTRRLNGRSIPSKRTPRNMAHSQDIQDQRLTRIGTNC